MGFLVDAVGAVFKAVGSVIGFVVDIGLSVLGLKPKAPAATTNNRLNKQLNPEDYNKIIFGNTASALDLRYWEVYGPSANYYDEVIALAAHRINSVGAFYVENELAINAAGVVQSKFAGVLTRGYRLGVHTGESALTIGGGSNWTSASVMRGVAQMRLSWIKNDDKLPNGPPSRYTQAIEGAPVYDPRRDSTRGGSGSHRINDQSTWEYSTLDSNGVPIGRNNALQALWYLLGWRVQHATTGEMILRCGRGVEISDINLQTFITGANNCEVAGYYTDMILSTQDEHTSNENKITADGLIATLIDPGGLWSYYANVDDTASIAVEFFDSDILDNTKVSWDEYEGMSQQFNQVVGKFVDPSVTALYQPRAYPMVRDGVYETNLGVKRRKAIDFEQIQDALLAQKLARLALNEGQFQAKFSANFNHKALRAQAWSIVRYTSERYQWSKLFRVQKYDLHTMNGVGMLLKEVHPSIWTPGTATLPVTIPLGQRYDPTTAYSVIGLAASGFTGTDANGIIYDGATLLWVNAPAQVIRTEVRFKKVGDTYWQTVGPFKSDTNTTNVFPLLSGENYTFEARHVTSYEIAGPWASINYLVGNNSNIVPGGIPGDENYIWVAYAYNETGTVGFNLSVPDDRGFEGLAVNKPTSVESTNPADYVWRPYRGPSTYGLTAYYAVVVGPDYVVRSGEAGGTYDGWNGRAFSSTAYVGGAFASFKVHPDNVPDGRIMVGLTHDPIPTLTETADGVDYANLDYSIHLGGDGNIYCYENGSGSGTYGTWATNDTLSVAYDNKFIRYYKNGIPFRVISAPANLTLYLAVSVAYGSGGAHGLKYGPQGAAGNDGANGTNGVNGINGINGQTFYDWHAYADSSDGVVRFTNGAPNGRTWRGVKEGNLSNIESTNPADYVWSPYTGPANFGLAASAGAQVSGNKIVRTAAYDGLWNQQVYSTEGFYQGAKVLFKPIPDNETGTGDYGAFFIGLNTDPLTNSDWTSIDYGIYCEGTAAGVPGNLYFAENGSLIYAGLYSYADIFSVVYDNVTIAYYKNGDLIRFIPASPDLLFYMDSSIAAYGARATVNDFGPAAKKGDQGNQGNVGNPGANAKTIYVTADFAQINFDGTGTPSPAVQTNVFVAQKQNTTNLVTWSLVDNLGYTIAPTTSYLSADSGDSVSMTVAQFNAALAVNNATAVIVIASIAADGISDRFSVNKKQDGTTPSGSPVDYAYGVIATVIIEPGATTTWEGAVRYQPTYASGTLYLQLQYSLKNSGVWNSFPTQSGTGIVGNSYGAPDPVNVKTTGSFSNVSGITQTYDIRAVDTGAAGDLNDPSSYLRKLS